MAAAAAVLTVAGCNINPVAPETQQQETPGFVPRPVNDSIPYDPNKVRPVVQSAQQNDDYENWIHFANMHLWLYDWDENFIEDFGWLPVLSPTGTWGNFTDRVLIKLPNGGNLVGQSFAGEICDPRIFKPPGFEGYDGFLQNKGCQMITSVRQSPRTIPGMGER